MKMRDYDARFELRLLPQEGHRLIASETTPSPPDWVDDGGYSPLHTGDLVRSRSIQLKCTHIVPLSHPLLLVEDRRMSWPQEAYLSLQERRGIDRPQGNVQFDAPSYVSEGSLYAHLELDESTFSWLWNELDVIDLSNLQIHLTCYAQEPSGLDSPIAMVRVDDKDEGVKVPIFRFDCYVIHRETKNSPTDARSVSQNEDLESDI